MKKIMMVLILVMLPLAVRAENERDYVRKGNSQFKSKKYNDADDFSVDDLSLIVEEKEIYGLLGPNGAGKTTLLSILCGLIKPTSGTFSINHLTYEKNGNVAQRI